MSSKKHHANVRCNSCDSTAKFYLEGRNHDCLKVGKRCALVDNYLAELFYIETGSPRSFSDLSDSARRIEEAHGKVLHSLKTYSPPQASVDFAPLVKSIHYDLFSCTGLSFAGTFRSTTVYYGTGKNQRMGSPSTEIDPLLIRCFEESSLFKDLELVTPERYARRCAIFLESFFRIHPFLDGNGRTARLILNISAHTSARFRFRQWDNDKTGKYVTALEYAHRHSDPQVAGELRGEKKDPYPLLEKWLISHLDVVPDTISEVPPSWIPQ